MLALSYKLRGVRGLFYTIASACGLSRCGPSPHGPVSVWVVFVGRHATARAGSRARVGRVGDSLFLFSKELEMVV